MRDEQKFSGNLFQRNSDVLKIKTTIKFLRKLYLKYTFQISSKLPLVIHILNELSYFSLIFLKIFKNILGAVL